MKQGEESAAVKIIKHRYGSAAQIILGTASGCHKKQMKLAELMLRKNQEESRVTVYAKVICITAIYGTRSSAKNDPCRSVIFRAETPMKEQFLYKKKAGG